VSRLVTPTLAPGQVSFSDLDRWREETADLDKYSLPFARFGVYEGEDPDLLYRDMLVFGINPVDRFGATLGFVNDSFWSERNAREVFLSAMLQGHVANEDDYSNLATEPDIRLSLNKLERYEQEATAHPELLGWRTVFYLWGAGCPPGNFKRGSQFVQALNAEHAELYVRYWALPTSQVPLVVTMVALGRVPQLDSADIDVYATLDGTLWEELGLDDPAQPTGIRRILHLFHPN
jgi:hypothetical protein